jgi:zinc D-Ala-D-Ala carboxypeptidase
VDYSERTEGGTQSPELPGLLDDTPPIAPPSLTSAMHEIPVAVREAPVMVKKRSPNPTKLWLWGLGGALAAFAVLAIPIALLSANSSKATKPSPSVATGGRSPAATSPATSPATSSNRSNNSNAPAGEPEQMLNHYKYDEAPQSELQPINADGELRLRKAAAAKFDAMVSAAQAEGVGLVPLSAFRSMADQDQLFFETGAQRGQVPQERAAVSAPPGYSEHHTGYAIDIGDGDSASTNLSEAFEQTKAYQWLKANAATYSFELSFPKGNEQGVSYEPWHWRFVGDRDSLKTFYRARSVKSPAK